MITVQNQIVFSIIYLYNFALSKANIEENQLNEGNLFQDSEEPKSQCHRITLDKNSDMNKDIYLGRIGRTMSFEYDTNIQSSFIYSKRAEENLICDQKYDIFCFQLQHTHFVSVSTYLNINQDKYEKFKNRSDVCRKWFMKSGINFDVQDKRRLNYLALAPNSDFYRIIKDFYSWSNSDYNYQSMLHDRILLNGIDTVNKVVEPSTFNQLRFADRYWLNNVDFNLLPSRTYFESLNTTDLNFIHKSICFDSEFGVTENSNAGKNRRESNRTDLFFNNDIIIGLRGETFNSTKVKFQELLCNNAISNDTTMNSILCRVNVNEDINCQELNPSRKTDLGIFQLAVPQKGSSQSNHKTLNNIPLNELIHCKEVKDHADFKDISMKFVESPAENQMCNTADLMFGRGLLKLGFQVAIKIEQQTQFFNPSGLSMSLLPLEYDEDILKISFVGMSIMWIGLLSIVCFGICLVLCINEKSMAQKCYSNFLSFQKKSFCCCCKRRMLEMNTPTSTKSLNNRQNLAVGAMSKKYQITDFNGEHNNLISEEPDLASNAKSEDILIQLETDPENLERMNDFNQQNGSRNNELNIETKDSKNNEIFNMFVNPKYSKILK